MPRTIPNGVVFTPGVRQITRVSFSLSRTDPRGSSVTEITVTAGFDDCYLPADGSAAEWDVVQGTVGFNATEFIRSHPVGLQFLGELKAFIESKATEQGL